MEKNNNFDDLNNIDMNELKKNVLNKLETKIAVEEFKIKEEIKDNENNNGNSNNTTSKVKSMRKKNNFLYRVAAVLIGIIFVGNVYTYAAYKENLFSFIVSRIGIIDNYSEKGEDVNLKEQSLGNDLTLQSYAIDNNNLVVTYNLKLEEKQEYFIDLLADNSSLIINGEEYYMTKNHSFDFFEISDTEYEIVKSYDIKEAKIADDVKFKTEITLYKELDGDIEEKLGVWNLEIDLDIKNENIVESQEYKIEDKKIYMYDENGEKTGFASEYQPDEEPFYETIYILGLEQTSLGTKLNFYSTIGVLADYFVEIIDEKGNVLLANNTERLIGNSESEIIFKSVDLNSKITINVDCVDYLENGEKGIVSEGSVVLDLSKDLKVKEKIEKEYIKSTWNDLSFELSTIDEIYEHETESVQGYYINLNEVGPIGQNDFIAKVSIETPKYKEISPEDFVKVCRLEALANGMGILDVNDTRTYYYYGDLPILEDDVSEIAIAGKIYINGEEVTEETLKEASDFYVTDIKKETYEGIDVYSFEATELENRNKVVVFKVYDTVYSIKFPKKLDAKEVTDTFMKSIEIIDR